MLLQAHRETWGGYFAWVHKLPNTVVFCEFILVSVFYCAQIEIYRKMTDSDIIWSAGRCRKPKWTYLKSSSKNVKMKFAR